VKQLVAIYLRSCEPVEEERPIFGRLVIDFTLPALIFSGLARQTFETSELAAK